MTSTRHYCYRIDFEDGFVYFGVRSCSCDPAEDTAYMGSPTTHKAKWLTDIPRVKTIVSEHETRELAEIAEDELIEAFWAASIELSLNATIRGSKFHRLGAKLTVETKAKMSESSKGKPKTDKHRASIGAAMKGKQHTDEARAKMSKAKKGKKGRPLSAEHRAKISNAKKGKELKPLTEEHRAKLADAGKGKKWYTDGITSIKLKPGDVIPEGFKPGMITKSRKQL